MRAFKWMTEEMQAFYDGHQFKWGWNALEGEKDGRVCVAGGVHLSKRQEFLTVAPNSKYDPNCIDTICQEVAYLKRDVLGEDPDKVRVRAFKILRKKPVNRHSPLYIFAPHYRQSLYDNQLQIYTGTSTWATA